MKKLSVQSILYLLISLLLAACTPEAAEQPEPPACTSYISNAGKEIAVELVDYAEIVIDESTITGEGLWCDIYNRSETEQITFGSIFVIVQYVDGAWREVPDLPDGNGAFFHTAIGKPPSTKPSQEFADWSNIYSKLKPGSYLILKRVTYGSDDPGDEYMSAQFTVS